MSKEIGVIDPRKSPSLKSWGHAPDNQDSQATQNACIECGWGRLIFAHTFNDNLQVAELLRVEKRGTRDIAFYVRDPQIIISAAPHEFFLDPSHTYRFDLSDFRSNPDTSGNFSIRPADFNTDLDAINRIYVSQNMVPLQLERTSADDFDGKLSYFVAVDGLDGHIVGAVMGVDHAAVFNDSEGGCSLWALAVDPQARYPGIGRALTDHVLTHFAARGRQFLDLSVMHSSSAMKLYESMGFYTVPVFVLKRKNVINEKLYVGNSVDGLNPYASIIVNEARRRGIGVTVLDRENNYFALTLGGHRVVCRESLSELTSAVAMSRCADKSVTHALMAEAGVRLPAQHVVEDSEIDFNFLKKYRHVAVKPADGEQGKGISLMVRSPDELELAIARARSVSEKVVLEEFVEGSDLRIVVINFEVVAAAIRRPAEVVGDGKHTIRELIRKQSRRREMATGGESSIPLDRETENCIQLAGYALSDVLPGRTVLQVRKTANLHTGGTIHDVTLELHPELADAAIKVARAINIPVVGVDFIVRSPAEADYVFIEANERPGLANHEPQPTAERFVDLLFPQTRGRP